MGAENHQRLSFRPRPCRGRNLLFPLQVQTQSRSLALLGMTSSEEVQRTSGQLYPSRENALDGCLAALSRADPDHVVHRVNKDFSVAGISRMGVGLDDLNDRFRQMIRHDDL